MASLTDYVKPIKVQVQDTPALQNVLESALALAKPDAIFPQLSSGARSYIIVGGNPVALCQNMTYSVTYDTYLTRTIDTNFPWEIVPGQATIQARLAQLIDPRTSAEASGMFTTMAAGVHQPNVELQVMDKFGTELFWARGMFVAMDSTVQINGLSTRSLEFVGIAYTDNVRQSFAPYSTGILSGAVDGLNQISSSLKSVGL